MPIGAYLMAPAIVAATLWRKGVGQDKLDIEVIGGSGSADAPVDID
jgi:hypothetical protein